MDSLFVFMPVIDSEYVPTVFINRTLVLTKVNFVLCLKKNIFLFVFETLTFKIIVLKALLLTRFIKANCTELYDTVEVQNSHQESG
jgi:hypothetical protein